jgi:hypothetical protein
MLIEAGPGGETEWTTYKPIGQVSFLSILLLDTTFQRIALFLLLLQTL